METIKKERRKREPCQKCKVNPSRQQKRPDRIFSYLSNYCASCESKARDGYSDKYIMKSSCEFCNFTPEHKAVLHIDHIDGNDKNNDPNNYQTLCANCHSIKSLIESRDRTIYTLSSLILDYEEILNHIGFHSGILPKFRDYKIVKIEKSKDLIH